MVRPSTVVSLERGNGQKKEKLPRSLWGLTLMIPLQPIYDTAANIKQPEIQANGVLTTEVIHPPTPGPISSLHLFFVVVGASTIVCQRREALPDT